MLLNQRNSKKQGDVGVGIAIGWFATKGWTVCIPLTDSQDYDLVVDNGDGLKKVQVRTTRHMRRNCFVVHMRVCGGNRTGSGKIKYFDASKVDYVFVVAENENKYLIPSSDLGIRSSLTLNKDRDVFKVN